MQCAFGTSFTKSGVQKDTGVSWTYISDKGSANTVSNQEQQPNSVHLGILFAKSSLCSINVQTIVPYKYRASVCEVSITLLMQFY